MAKKQNRSRYSPWVKQQVILRYPECRTTQDKWELARDLDIRDEDGEPSVNKLYNLASRLHATGRAKEDDNPASFAKQEDRLRERENPDETVWQSSSDSYLKREFGRRAPEYIAVYVNHTETAVVYRARKLGLRKPIKHWNARKVAFWLSLTMEELHELRMEGIDIHPLHDRTGHLQVEVVSSTSLGRWLHEDGNLERVRANQADEYFIREILETLDELASKEAEWELCKFISAGHICQNPYALQTSFGLFCPNTERQQAGDDPACSVKNLAIDDLRPVGH